MGNRDHGRNPSEGLTIAVMDSNDLRRRLKAARALTAPTQAEIDQRSPRTRNAETGITVEELALRLSEPGLGWKTLGAIERGEREAQRRDLIVIAEALEMPFAFFTVSREELAAALGDAGAPGVPGETGRRLREQRPTGEDRQQYGNGAEGGHSHEAGG